MKKFLLFVIGIFLLPINVFALNNGYVQCEKIKLKNNDEVKCEIYVYDMDFITTSISGQIKLDENLELVSSSYDSETWQMLDEEFSVESINLISENKEEKEEFVVASFVVRAINKKDVSIAKISFENVLFGDENYENHEMIFDSFDLNLDYQTNYRFIFLIFIFLVMSVIFVVRNNKKSNIKVNVLIFILLLLLVPNRVDAVNDLVIDCDKTKLSKNEEISCDLSVKNLNFTPTDVVGVVKVGNNLSITSSSYNKSNWVSFDSNFSVKDINLIRQSDKEISKIVIASFKVKSSSNASGSSTISFNNVSMGDTSYNGISLGNKSINIYFNSSVNTLSSLSVSEGNIDFSKDKTNYSLTVSGDSITISAIATDSKAKISGIGKKTLSYGENTLKVVVTAEDGSKKTYTLNVTRKDDRSTNNYLKSLSLSEDKINFNKNTNSYNISVEGDIDKVNISASLEDSKAKFVSGFGPRIVNLDYGKNVVLVKVLSENEKERVYTLNITRDDNRSNDTNLKNITISEGVLEFNKDKLNYDVYVTNEIEKVSIKAEATDLKSSVVIDGPDSLEVGENVFIIKVTAENGDIKEYEIVVTREKKIIVTEDNKLTNIKIKNYELEFSSDKYEYVVKTNKSKLDIEVSLSSEDSTYVINGNDDLEDGSIISIVVTDKDGNNNIYKIYIEEVHEINIFLILFIISLLFNILFIIIILFNKKHKKKRS